MALKLILDANKIYHKEFQGTKPGYDALQVDTFLDFVIRDYQSMDDYVKETEQKEKELNALLQKQGKWDMECRHL